MMKAGALLLVLMTMILAIIAEGSESFDKKTLNHPGNEEGRIYILCTETRQ